MTQEPAKRTSADRGPQHASSECSFCLPTGDPHGLTDRIIWEDESFLVTHPLEADGPTYLGLLLLQTKRHVAGLADLRDDESRELGLLMARLSRSIKECTGAAWTYGYAFMEGVRHVHMFIVARYSATPKEYHRLGIVEWPERPQGGPEEVAQLSARLRKVMANPPGSREIEIGRSDID